ncbi:MAG: bifunctional folylpolyglutamate synthase/dihydrofolate synthase [Moorellales bacterium]
MDYREAVAYLESYMRLGIHLGLDRIRDLLERLGNPHLDLPVVHVGGTNGKGSTAAMLASILQAAGYRTGLFTSPHLVSYTERFRIDGRPINPEEFARLVEAVRPAVAGLAAERGEEPTEFEVLTAMAWAGFREQGVEVAVMEVGMGGEHDATNAVPMPLVSVITNVGWDHMEHLGRTLEAIARTKAGIIKPGGFAVTAAEGEALEAVRERCREVEARLFVVQEETQIRPREADTRGQRFDLTVMGREYPELFLPLLGPHQLANAATAVLAAEVLARFRGLELGPEAVREGLARVSWPARLELWPTRPLLAFDAAHNRDAARALRAAVERLAFRRIILVVGLLADKEREAIMDLLAPLAAAVVVTRPLSPRAGDWEKVASMAARHVGAVYAEADLDAALDRALGLAGEEDMVLVTGSFYLVGEARARMERWAPGAALRDDGVGAGS